MVQRILTCNWVLYLDPLFWSFCFSGLAICCGVQSLQLFHCLCFFFIFYFRSSYLTTQTTDMNLGQAHFLDSRAQTILDLWIGITQSKKPVIQGFTELHNSYRKFLPDCKANWHDMANRRELCAREGFAYHSVKLVSLANGNRYEVDWDLF
jgi:hypothetical protein